MQMAAKYEITAQQKAEIEEARKTNKDKRIEVWLKFCQCGQMVSRPAR